MTAVTFRFRPLLLQLPQVSCLRRAATLRSLQFVADRKLTEGADEVFVNGDAFIPNVKALGPVFQAWIFAEAQA